MNEKYKQEVDSIDASNQFKKELKQNIAKKKISKSFVYAMVLVTCILFALLIFPKKSKQDSSKTPQVLDNPQM